MAITGITFNFHKNVSSEGDEPSTPAAPADDSKIETKIAGEKTGARAARTFVNLAIVQQMLKTTINNSIQNIENSQLAEQSSALQSIAINTVSSVFMAATNPYALVASLACQGISYGFKVAKRNRERAWENYDISEYQAARGYSAASSRSRRS